MPCHGALAVGCQGFVSPRAALRCLEQIEPSAAGGAIIASLIAHVAAAHDFSGPSCFYVHRPAAGITAEPNSEAVLWSVSDAWRDVA